MLGEESLTSEARLDPEAPEFEYSVGLNANAAEFQQTRQVTEWNLDSDSF